MKVAENQEKSHGALAYTGIFAKNTADWNAIVSDPNTDPNDPTIKQKFMASLEPQLEDFKNSFQTEEGQRYAEAHADALRMHFVEKTDADMSTRAGQAAKSNIEGMINSLSTTVLNDPTALKFRLSSLRSNVEATISSSLNLSGVQAGAVRTELMQKGSESLVKSAALGAIMRTGQVPAWINDPDIAPFVNGPEIKQLVQTARYYENVNRTEERNQREEVHRTQTADFNAKRNQIEIDMLPDKPGDPPKVPSEVFDRLRQLGIHPGAGYEPGALATTYRNVEAVIDRVNKPEPLGAVSHDTTMSLLGEIRTGKVNDNGPIYQAYQAGKLNRADFQFLQGEFNNIRTPDGAALESDRKLFMGRFSKVIDGSMTDAGVPSLLGTQHLYDFEMGARQQEAVLRKQGQDPHLVYQPGSQYYFGRPENIAKYHVSLQQAQQYEKDFRAMDKANAEALAAPKTPAPGARVKQGGHTFERQPDGSYKAID